MDIVEILPATVTSPKAYTVGGVDEIVGMTDR
jgi:hypothetical protein